MPFLDLCVYAGQLYCLAIMRSANGTAVVSLNVCTVDTLRNHLVMECRAVYAGIDYPSKPNCNKTGTWLTGCYQFFSVTKWRQVLYAPPVSLQTDVHKPYTICVDILSYAQFKLSINSHWWPLTSDSECEVEFAGQLRQVLKTDSTSLQLFIGSYALAPSVPLVYTFAPQVCLALLLTDGVFIRTFPVMLI